VPNRISVGFETELEFSGATFSERHSFVAFSLPGNCSQPVQIFQLKARTVAVRIFLSNLTEVCYSTSGSNGPFVPQSAVFGPLVYFVENPGHSGGAITNRGWGAKERHHWGDYRQRQSALEAGAVHQSVEIRRRRLVPGCVCCPHTHGQMRGSRLYSSPRVWRRISSRCSATHTLYLKYETSLADCTEFSGCRGGWRPGCCLGASKTGSTRPCSATVACPSAPLCSSRLRRVLPRES